MSLKIGEDNKKRCFGNGQVNDILSKYHDEEWGVVVKDDQTLFEMLTLEGAQAGLSWETVLKKREGYKNAFHNFNIQKVSQMKDSELESLRENPEIIRNRLKIYSVRKNALAVLEIQKEFGSLYKYLWSFINGKQIKNSFMTLEKMPASTEVSDMISKDMKKRGMSFVGSTIIYAYMQGVGMVNDHVKDCWCYKK